MPKDANNKDNQANVSANKLKNVNEYRRTKKEYAYSIEQVMQVQPMVGTACFGSPYVGAGICASNNGAIAGTETTGPEMNRIEDALGLI